MKSITCWGDLKPFGIDLLTGEACGLMYRYLCDLTDQGKRIIEKCLGCRIEPAEQWNRGTAEAPHIGSIMLSPEMLTPLSIFALLESGCCEVYVVRDHGTMGVEANDDDEVVLRIKQHFGDRLGRRFAYRGTAGDRNVHQMSGRVE